MTPSYRWVSQLGTSWFRQRLRSADSAVQGAIPRYIAAGGTCDRITIIDTETWAIDGERIKLGTTVNSIDFHPHKASVLVWGGDAGSSGPAVYDFAKDRTTPIVAFKQHTNRIASATAFAASTRT